MKRKVKEKEYNNNLQFLVFGRIEWENIGTFWIKWTKKELDKAEKSDNGFIGMKEGINCFLSSPINITK